MSLVQNDSCANDTCVNDTCANDTCANDICANDTCVITQDAKLVHNFLKAPQGI